MNLTADQIAALTLRRDVLAITTRPPRPPDRDECLTEIGTVFDDEADVDSYIAWWNQDDEERNYKRFCDELSALNLVLGEVL